MFLYSLTKSQLWIANGSERVDRATSKTSVGTWTLFSLSGLARGLFLKFGLNRFKGWRRLVFKGTCIQRAGFENIVPETRNEMPLLSSEWVAGAAAGRYFSYGVDVGGPYAARAGWKRIPAVQKKRIILLDADLFSRAGPRVVEALAELHRVRREVEMTCEKWRMLFLTLLGAWVFFVLALAVGCCSFAGRVLERTRSSGGWAGDLV
jgi:hypothetical protein